MSRVLLTPSASDATQMRGHHAVRVHSIGRGRCISWSEHHSPSGIREETMTDAEDRAAREAGS